MHQRTVLHIVSITSGNELELSEGGGAEQAAHAEQQGFTIM